MPKFLKNKLVSGALIGLLVWALTLILLATTALDSLHLSFSSSLFTRDQPSEDIIIVAIDDRSTEATALGRYTQWGRDNYGLLLQKLIPEEPKAIAIDLVFNNPTQNVSIQKIKDLKNEAAALTNGEKLAKYDEFIEANSNFTKIEEDNFFAEQIEAAGNVILGFINFIDGNGKDVPIVPIDQFLTKANSLGYAAASTEDDGILRSIPVSYLEPISQRSYDTLAAASARKYLDLPPEADLGIPTKDGEMLINYFADPFQQKMISFVDILNGNYEAGIFQDKVVLVGLTSFKEVQDKVLTPRSNKTPMPGVEVHANILQTILEGKFLTNQSLFGQLMTLLLISITLAVAFNYLGIILSTLLAISALIIYLLAAHFFYRRGLILNMIYPFITIILTYIAAWVYRYFVADKSKREIKGAFGKYVSKELVDQIAKNPEKVKLGGEKRIITVFFSDIKGSTSWSEVIPIADWVQQINEYFTAMEAIIQKLGGTLDKYEGDAIMGFWNAPIEQFDHVTRAYVAALEMQKTLKTVLYPKWKAEDKPMIEFRIGINTGEAIVGNFGSVNRFDYTAMGDTVNTASRLESSANKTYGSSIVVAGFEELLTADQRKNLFFRELDTVLLPGKKEAVKLYELVCLTADLTPEIQATIQSYHSGLAAYRTKDFATAISHFIKLPNDAPSKILLARCQSLQKGEATPELHQDTMVFHIQNK